MSGLRTLYPASEPFNQGKLAVSDLHTIHYAEHGNPEGIPMLFLHGGPGSGCAPYHHQFFDPAAFRIILPDQRGCGKSTPHAETRENTPDDLVRDLEQLRQELGIESWHIFGGSWGSTLALLSAQEHPENCRSLTLRGLFAMRREEVHHFIHGMGKTFPEAQERFVDFLPKKEQGDLFESYYKRLMDPDPAIHRPAAIAWTNHESESFSINSTGRPEEPMPDHVVLSMARIEAAYFRNHLFTPDDRVLKNCERIRHIPAYGAQGRFDQICPPTTAHAFKKAMPSAQIEFFRSGHDARDPETLDALIRATDRIRDTGSPLLPKPHIRPKSAFSPE